MPFSGGDSDLASYWNPAQSITETSFSAMAKDTRVTFDSGAAHTPNKPSNKVRHNRVTERQISFEDAENYVNEISESFPAFTTRAHKLMRQVSGSFNSRTIKVALILSVILNLLLAIPFGIFFGIWVSQRHGSAGDNAQSSSSSLSSSSSSSSSSSQLDSLKSYTIVESCFPCSENDIDLGSRVKVKSKNNICCTDDKIYDLENSPYFCLTADVFKKRCLGNPEVPRGPVPCKPGSTSSNPSRGENVVAAHLMLDVEQTKAKMKDSSHQNKIPLVWIGNDVKHITFIGDGVEYFNGQIKINKSGKYHIYCHITLSSLDNPMPENQTEINIVHALSWTARGVNKDLLFAQVTLKSMELKSSSIEGTFDLLSGDIVSVYLSHPSLVKDTSAANVFGLFML